MGAGMLRTGFRPPLRLGMGAGSCDVEVPSLGRVALSGSGDEDSESGVRASSKGSNLGRTSYAVVTSVVAMDPISKSKEIQTNAKYLT